MELLNCIWVYLVSNVSFGHLKSVAYCWYYRGPLINGYVLQNLSWQMGFWFTSIPLGICLVLVFFFVPEVRQSTSFCNLNIMKAHC